MIDQLRASDLPIVIYGAGHCARSIADSLREVGVRPAAFCVDDRFLTVDLTVDGVSVDGFSAVCRRIPRFDVAVGFGTAQPDWDTLRNCKSIRHCFGNVGFARGQAMDTHFAQSHWGDFEDCYAELSDAASKNGFLEYLRSRLLGHSAELPTQCFPESTFGCGLLKLGRHEVYCDCGAYDGDTLRMFVSNCVEYKRIYAWEPDPANATALSTYVKSAGLQNLSIIQKCATDQRGLVGFQSLGSSVSGIDIKRTERVECDTIDNLCSDATVIKIDVEGAELLVLQGARETILKHKPKIVVAIYHRREDLFMFQKLLRELRDDYKFYFRWHRPAPDDVMLYAI